MIQKQKEIEKKRHYEELKKKAIEAQKRRW